MTGFITTILFTFAALNGALGALVLWRGQKKLHRFFFAGLSFMVALWSLALASFYFEFIGDGLRQIFLFTLHLAALSSVGFFALFAAVFPSAHKKLLRIACIGTIGSFLVNFYLIFIRKSVVSSAVGENLLYELGPDYNTYAVFILLNFLLGFWLLYKQYKRVHTKQKKSQIVIIFAGTMATVVFAILTNLLLPAYGAFNLTWLGPIFTVFLVGATFYSAVKHQLFQMELVLTELFTLMLVILLTGDLFQADSEDIAPRSIILVLTVVLSYFLVRSVQREVEQRQRAEKLSEKLKDLNKELHKLDEMKTEFLSLASHQLRTPLTSIKGYSSMILEGSFGRISNKVRTPIERIFESSSILAKIITDLLDVSKIEQGGLQYEMLTFSLASMVQSVVDEQQVSAKDKKIKLSLEMKQPGRYALKGDQVKLRQVVVNLVDNAIKYTDTGGWVKVLLQKRKQGDKKYIEIKVEDNGRGISPEMIKKLFQKFSRGQAGKKTNTGGSGLGLYLAKQIVKAHAGDLVVESDGVGKGSRFIIELPQEY